MPDHRDGSRRDRTGARRHWIQILVDPATSNTITRNSLGEPVANPQPTVTRAAEIVAVSGREFYYADQVTSDASHLMRFTFVPGLTEKMQISLTENAQTRTFEIQSVLNPGELQGTTLTEVLVKETTTSAI